jgi:hypothetical protein
MNGLTEIQAANENEAARQILAKKGLHNIVPLKSTSALPLPAKGIEKQALDGDIAFLYGGSDIVVTYLTLRGQEFLERYADKYRKVGPSLLINAEAIADLTLDAEEADVSVH